MLVSNSKLYSNCISFSFIHSMLNAKFCITIFLSQNFCLGVSHSTTTILSLLFNCLQIEDKQMFYILITTNLWSPFSSHAIYLRFHWKFYLIVDCNNFDSIHASKIKLSFLWNKFCLDQLLRELQRWMQNIAGKHQQNVDKTNYKFCKVVLFNWRPFSWSHWTLIVKTIANWR